jgi:hypothetical protein
MKAGQTKSAIEAYADALNFERLPDTAARLRALCAVFRGLAARPMTDLLDLLDKAAPEQDQAAEKPPAALVADVIQSLGNLEIILTKTSTPARRNDLIEFRTRLQRHESASINALVGAVQVLRRGTSDGGTVEQTQYEQLADQLKAALGCDERFDPLFKRLTNLNAKGVAAVANLLMSSGTSKSRQRDLKRIRERHESQRSLHAKQRVMAGRTAA